MATTTAGFITAIRSSIRSASAVARSSIHNLQGGVVTRGVLIDIPRLKGVQALEPNTPVFIEDIEAWEKQAGENFGRRRHLPAYGPLDRRPDLGFDISVAPWLKARDVALVGTDGTLDVAGQVANHTLPLHSTCWSRSA